MNLKTPLIVVGLILALALFAGAWQSDVFAKNGTVPPVVPPKPTRVATLPIPVIGKCVIAIAVKAKPVLVDLTGDFQSGAEADVLKAGMVLRVCRVDPNKLYFADTLHTINEVFYVAVLDKDKEINPQKLVKKGKITFVLSTDEVDAFKKDPTLGILWYDAEHEKWVRLVAVLKDDKLTVDTDALGYFLFGSLK